MGMAGRCRAEIYIGFDPAWIRPMADGLLKSAAWATALLYTAGVFK
jgi:hypothetical protein